MNWKRFLDYIRGSRGQEKIGQSTTPGMILVPSIRGTLPDGRPLPPIRGTVERVIVLPEAKRGPSLHRPLAAKAPRIYDESWLADYQRALGIVPGEDISTDGPEK